MTTLSLCTTAVQIYHNALAHNLRRLQRFTCTSVVKTTSNDPPVEPNRRCSGNYEASPWDHRYLLSIDNTYARTNKIISRDLLKKKLRKMLNDETKTHFERLDFIDDLQKLGVSYHFVQEIDKILTSFYHKNEETIQKYNKEQDLHAISLEFRLLRQHGFNISEDIFDVILNKIESDDDILKNSDIKSIISLYEASYLSTKMDTKMHKIRFYASEKLKKFVNNHDYNYDDIYDYEITIHALEMPYHWRMRRLETRWYIDMYEMKHNMNITLSEFAKIDFNIVQSVHQEDLKYVSSWWNETNLSDQLHFVRDRIVENYFWTVGTIYEPEHGNIRRMLSKVNALITTIDDIYDIYGTLEELQLFTSMVDKWDINRLDELPKYMKLCFLVLHNEINGIGCDILKNKNINVIPFLSKAWGDLCKAYLVEAKWYKKGYKPSVDEYMQNAWISISAPTILLHLYCLISDKIPIQILETLSRHQQQIVRCSSTVLRLANDLGTSPDELERGDVLKSIQCYMYENGVSEEEARTHVRHMISDTWDDRNYEKTASSSWQLPDGFVEAAMNLARMSQCMYEYGDGHGFPDKAKTVDRVISLLINPILLD